MKRTEGKELERNGTANHAGKGKQEKRQLGEGVNQAKDKKGERLAHSLTREGNGKTKKCSKNSGKEENLPDLKKGE